MPTVCNISFENNQENVFYGGQLLLGHVELSLTNSKEVRGIYVEISGEAYCHWTEGSGDSKKTYTGNETYLNERTFLVGGRDGEITVQPGHYSYDFSCNLPLGLPTSLEAEYGHIRYRAKVVLDRPMWPDQEYERIFTVIKPLNLNLDPSVRLPRVQEKYKTFYPCCLFCCCPSDPMHMVARIPVGGYTPGQTINVEIEVDNKSDEETDFSVQLWKCITFHTYANSSRQKDEELLIYGKDGIGYIGTNSSESFRASLVIPPIPPTDFDGSNICKVRYVLRVEGPISGCHNDAKVEIPIIIGSYPILDEPNRLGYPTAASGGGYQFPVSSGTGPIVQQPTVGFNMPSAPGGYPEPTDPLLRSNGTAPYPPAYPNAAPPYPGAINPSLPPLPSIATAPPNPSAPYPEFDPPTYEQATKRGEDGKSFRPNYPVYRRATSYSSASNE